MRNHLINEGSEHSNNQNESQSNNQNNNQNSNKNSSYNIDAREQDLIKVWTKMGASTGSMIGRLIGVGAALGLETIRAVNEPLSRNLQEMKKRTDP